MYHGATMDFPGIGFYFCAATPRSPSLPQGAALFVRDLPNRSITSSCLVDRVLVFLLGQIDVSVP